MDESSNAAIAVAIAKPIFEIKLNSEDGGDGGGDGGGSRGALFDGGALSAFVIPVKGEKKTKKERRKERKRRKKEEETIKKEAAEANMGGDVMASSTDPTQNISTDPLPLSASTDPSTDQSTVLSVPDKEKDVASSSDGSSGSDSGDDGDGDGDSSISSAEEDRREPEEPKGNIIYLMVIGMTFYYIMLY